MLIARSIGTANKVKVVDKAEEKRVELHLHTNMSQMDAVTSAGDLVKEPPIGDTRQLQSLTTVLHRLPDAAKAADKINKDGEKSRLFTAQRLILWMTL